MTSVKFQIKQELKELSKKIRIQKQLSKSKQRESVFTYKDYWETIGLQDDFRHRHIARCLLRGTPYQLIEPKVREGNSPNMELVERYKQEYSERISAVELEVSNA